MKTRLIPIVLALSFLGGCAAQTGEPPVSVPTQTPQTSAISVTASELPERPATSAMSTATAPIEDITEPVTSAKEETETAATTVATVPPATAATAASTAVSTEAQQKIADFSEIVINEVCASNKGSVTDSDGDSPDWIELYNSGDATVNLSGCGLSDDAANPLKWVFPDVEIAPGGYLIVFCSDKNRTDGELHANFKISSDGETIALSSPDKERIDSVTVANLSENMTYSRLPDGGKFATANPSPLASNSEAKVYVSAPVFDKQSGFYSSSFNLNITASDNTYIYYTTDGSLPTSGSQKFSSPILIADCSSERAVLTYRKGTTVDSSSEQFPSEEFEKARIIRAIAIDKNGNQSAVSTATYFVGQEISRKYKNARVISVASDPDGLYNAKSGIYVAGDVFSEWRQNNPNGTLDGSTPANFNQRGREWEREAHVDLFNSEKLEFSADVGVRIHGGWSRNSQQKSMKFYFRSDYGQSSLGYELFENNRAYDSGKKVKKYKRFMIRNGGNDSFCLLYKDPWTQACVSGFPFATQANDLVIAFLDGEYWGIYTMMELYDDNYLAENFGIDADNAVMIKAGGLEEGNEDDYSLWDGTVKFISQNDMSDAENYKKASEMMDLDSFAEYVAMNVYIGNEDWIWGNWAAWRVRKTSDRDYEDGKWRFMCYDTEYSMNLYDNGRDYRYDILTQLAGGDGHLGPMFKSLLKNSAFQTKFILACEDMMNIAFNPDSASALLDSFHSKYAPYIPQHFKRFVMWQSLHGIEKNRDGWKSWLKNRQSYFPQQMAKVLSTPSKAEAQLTLTLKGSGTIKVNGIPIKFTNGKWTGKYINGYKITVEASVNSGSTFAGWSGGYSSSGTSFEWEPGGKLEISAEFVKK